MLWQHFFWIFGHPEVYILIFPAFAIRFRSHSGLLAEADFRMVRRWWGRWSAIGFISIGVWAHHMFAVGMTPLSNTFFARTTHAGW